MLVMRSMASVEATPTVIWHSQPVKPGQTVMLYGEGLARARVRVRRFPD